MIIVRLGTNNEQTTCFSRSVATCTVAKEYVLMVLLSQETIPACMTF